MNTRFLLAFAAISLMGTNAYAADVHAHAPPQVMATGTCTVAVVPDRAEVTVTVQRSGVALDAVAKDATETFNAFEHDVESLNLPDAVLTGSGVAVEKAYDDQNGQRSFRDYQASAALTIETTDAEKLASVLPVAAKYHIDDIGRINLSISEMRRNQAIEGCLSKASADAKAKAAALAQGVGATLGPPISILNFNTGAEPPPPRPMMRMMAAAAPAPVVPVGVQHLTVSTTVSFRLGEPENP